MVPQINVYFSAEPNKVCSTSQRNIYLGFEPNKTHVVPEPNKVCLVPQMNLLEEKQEKAEAEAEAAKMFIQCAIQGYMITNRGRSRPGT